VKRTRPEGVSYAERDAVMLLGLLDNPANPVCAGPVVVHRDGVFGCTRRDCDGCGRRYHGEDNVWPCDLVELPGDVPRCGRCRAGKGRRRGRR
jgi:hypothetical protein